MTNQVAIQLVNVRTLKIVKLLTFKAEDLVAHNHADMDAFTVQYIAVHDQRPIVRPSQQRLRLLGADSETNRGPRAISPSPSASFFAGHFHAFLQLLAFLQRVRLTAISLS